MPLGTKYQILLGYSIFLMAFFSIQVGVGYELLTGSMPIVRKPVCTSGFILIDGLFDCAWQYLQPLLVLFDVNSSLGIFNAVILIPFFIFLAYLIIATLRGVA
jgi:hypothetical protein